MKSHGLTSSLTELPWLTLRKLIVFANYNMKLINLTISVEG